MKHRLTHLWPSLFGLVTQTTRLSHLMVWHQDDLSSAENNKVAFPLSRIDFTRAINVARKRRLVSSSAFVYLKRIPSCLVTTGCAIKWWLLLTFLQVLPHIIHNTSLSWSSWWSLTPEWTFDPHQCWWTCVTVQQRKLELEFVSEFAEGEQYQLEL